MTQPHVEAPPPSPSSQPVEAGTFRNAWTLFRVRGVPVKLDVTWLLIAAYVTFLFFQRMSRPTVLGDLGLAVVLGAAAVAALLFFASLLAHELGHALTSLDRGVPVLSITLFLLGGVTEATREARSAKDEFVIVGIGPFISLALAAAFGLLFLAVRDLAPAAVVAGYLAWTNLALAIFNVVPGYPLDGGRLLRSVLWGVTRDPHRATRWAARVGQAFAAALIVIGAWGLLGLPVDALGGPLRVLLASGTLWELIIGLFLFRGATDAHRRATRRERLARRTVRDTMGAAPPFLSPSASLLDAVAQVQQRPSLLWPVGAPVVGGLTLAAIDAVARERWPDLTVRDVALPADEVTVDVDASLDGAVERMVRAPGQMLIAVEGGNAVGLLTPSLVAGLSAT